MTRELFSHGTLDERGSAPRLALFSGPHGISVLVGEYETVLMVATGFGIAAQLPYLRKLIHGYNTAKLARAESTWCGSSKPLVSLDIGNCITRADKFRYWPGSAVPTEQCLS